MDNRNTIIKNKIWSISLVLLLSVIWINALANEFNNKAKRVPAEWETHEATWMQWPGYWEKDYEVTFAKIADIISNYQKLHILYHLNQIYNDAQKAIINIGKDP